MFIHINSSFLCIEHHCQRKMDPESGEGNLIMNNDDASLSSDDDSRAREIEGNIELRRP